MNTIADHAASRRYRAGLERYLSSQVVGHDRRFLCSAGSACRASADDRGFGFAGGQLSYVGRSYACRAPTAPVRIVIVSMQVGDDEAPVTMSRRAEQVLARIPERPGRRNPHMRGVTRALQILHGLSLEPNDERLFDGTHVLEAYAMANSVLCSALPTGGRSRRGQPTSTMLSNCSRHVATTLSLLEPTIVHAQGADTRSAVEDVTSLIERITDEVSVIGVGDRQAIFCATSHPAAGPPKSWSSLKPGSYFADVVKPALTLTRELSLQQA